MSELDKVTRERDLYLKRGLELRAEIDHLKNESFYPIQTNELNEVFTALAEAQGEFPLIQKDSMNYNKQKYASLEYILQQIKPILKKYKLNFHQYFTGRNTLHTRIGHSSGQFFESQYQVYFPTRVEHKESKSTRPYEQELGCIRTYVRRYEAVAILGIQPGGEDTDGI